MRDAGPVGERRESDVETTFPVRVWSSLCVFDDAVTDVCLPVDRIRLEHDLLMVKL